MSYGIAIGHAALPVTFYCLECLLGITIHMPVDKDYGFEAVIQGAARRLKQSCKWIIDGADAWCADCGRQK